MKKSGVLQTCHSALDAESNIYNKLEIHACAGMTFLMIFSKVSYYKLRFAVKKILALAKVYYAPRNLN